MLLPKLKFAIGTSTTLPYRLKALIQPNTVQWCQMLPSDTIKTRDICIRKAPVTSESPHRLFSDG